MNREELWIAYGEYFATGEGMTVDIAIATTKEQALSLYKERKSSMLFDDPDYLVQWGEDVDMAQRMPRYIPPVVDHMLTGNHMPSFSYFMHLHFNMS